MTKTRIIAVAGGTASGKTTLARDLVRVGGASKLRIIPLDAYYRCNGHLTPEARALINYDHPDAFEVGLLEKHLAALAAGGAVDVPQYDFSTHSRSAKTSHVAPPEVIVIEGILALHYPGVRQVYYRSVFVDTPDALRFTRRLARDVRERGRTEDSVHRQWEETVQPMHAQFCAPTKAFASEIFGGEGWNDTHVATLLERLLR